MKSILFLFGDVAGYFASISLLFPIIASIWIRKKKVILNTEMRLFEGLVYFALISQLLSHSNWIGLTDYKNLILTFYLTLHLMFFSYLLIKWSGKFNKSLEISIGITIISLVLTFFFGEYNLSAEMMFWLDTFILLILSVYLSFIRDKTFIKINCEYNFIHNAIYVSSLLTVLGIALPKLDVIFFGSFIHTLANITCNIYFARSFKCLYR